MNSTEIHEIQALSYYCASGVKIMNLIEDVTGKMFHETHSELEDSFWAANDSRDLNALKNAYQKLVQLHDSLTMD